MLGRSTLITLTFIVLTGADGRATETDCILHPYEASFEVRAMGVNTGTSHEKVIRTDDRFTVTTKADAHVLFYHRNEFQKSEGTLLQGNIVPEIYSWTIVDGSQGSLKIPAGQLDTQTLGLRLRADLIRNRLPKTVDVIDPKGETQTASIERIAERKKLRTQLGEFEVEILKTKGLSLIQELWYDTANHHRLLRTIVHDPAVGRVEITILTYQELATACILSK